MSNRQTDRLNLTMAALFLAPAEGWRALLALLGGPRPSGGLKTAVVAVKAVKAVKSVGAVGGPNWELQLPIRSI